MPFPSFHSLFESGQHARRPHRSFNPGPSVRKGWIRVSSRIGNIRRRWVRISHIHLPAVLGSICFHRFLRYYDGSDCCPACDPALIRTAIPDLCHVIFRPFHHQPPDNNRRSLFPSCSISVGGFLLLSCFVHLKPSSDSRSGLRIKLECSPCYPAESCSSPADWSSVLCCFPPHHADLRDDAVTLNVRAEHLTRRGLSPL